MSIVAAGSEQCRKLVRNLDEMSCLIKCTLIRTRWSGTQTSIILTHVYATCHPDYIYIYMCLCLTVRRSLSSCVELQTVQSRVQHLFRLVQFSCIHNPKVSQILYNKSIQVGFLSRIWFKTWKQSGDRKSRPWNVIRYNLNVIWNRNKTALDILYFYVFRDRRSAGRHVCVEMTNK